VAGSSLGTTLLGTTVSELGVSATKPITHNIPRSELPLLTTVTFERTASCYNASSKSTKHRDLPVFQSSSVPVFKCSSVPGFQCSRVPGVRKNPATQSSPDKGRSHHPGPASETWSYAQPSSKRGWPTVPLATASVGSQPTIITPAPSSACT
jgi:hypothetical protein